MQMQSLELLQSFIAGEIDPIHFREALYNHDELETFFANDPNRGSVNYVNSSGGTYYFLLELDYSDHADVLNAQGAITDFMDRNNIAYTKTDNYSELYDLVLDAQPDWLDVESEYISKNMLPYAGDRQGNDLKEWLRNEFLIRFKYLKEPPDWIQAANWPIGKNGPLLFFGQLAIEDYFHDSASCYVFYDSHTGTCENVIQTY